MVIGTRPTPSIITTRQRRSWRVNCVFLYKCIFIYLYEHRYLHRYLYTLIDIEIMRFVLQRLRFGNRVYSKIGGWNEYTFENQVVVIYRTDGSRSVNERTI